jgi:hypothetical protein
MSVNLGTRFAGVQIVVNSPRQTQSKIAEETRDFNVVVNFIIILSHDLFGVGPCRRLSKASWLDNLNDYEQDVEPTSSSALMAVFVYVPSLDINVHAG